MSARDEVAVLDALQGPSTLAEVAGRAGLSPATTLGVLSEMLSGGEVRRSEGSPVLWWAVK